MQANRKAHGIHTNLTAALSEGLRTTGLPFQWETTGKLPHNPASGTQYNMQNLIMLARTIEKVAHEAKIPEKALEHGFMTLKQANSQGLKIKKESKGTQISYYSWTDKEPAYDKNGDPELGENGKQKMRTVYLDKPILQSGYLFHVSHLEGNAVQAEPEKTAEEKKAALDRAEALIKASGAVIVHDAKIKEAFYDRFKDQINMPPVDSFPSREALIGETINQLSYWSGHEDRLNRQSGPNGTLYRGREELATGLGAWATLNSLGVEGATFNNRGQQVRGMLKVLESGPYEAMRCCKTADAIRDHLMGLERQKDLTAEVSQETELEAGSRVAAVGKPTHEKPGLQVMTPEEELAQAIQDAGLELGGKPIIWTGETVVLQGGKGTYSATKDVIPEAVIRNQETGVRVSWLASGHKLTPEAVKTQEEKTQSVRNERQKGRKKAAEQGLDAEKIPLPAKSKGQSRGLSL